MSKKELNSSGRTSLNGHEEEEPLRSKLVRGEDNEYEQTRD